MGFICIGHEVFFLLFYLLHFYDFLTPSIGNLLSSLLQHESIRSSSNIEPHIIHHLPTDIFVDSRNSYFGVYGALRDEGIYKYISYFLTIVFLFHGIRGNMKIIIHALQLYSGMMDLADFEEESKEGKRE